MILHFGDENGTCNPCASDVKVGIQPFSCGRLGTRASRPTGTVFLASRETRDGVDARGRVSSAPGRHETESVQCALRYKPKTPLPEVYNKTPPSPKPKPHPPTKKQGPHPKKQEDWPSLSAASSSNKSSPPQVGWLSVASHSSLNAKAADAPIYALLRQIQEENRALRKHIHDLKTSSLSTNISFCTTIPAPQCATDNPATPSHRANDDQTTTMDTTTPPTTGTSTKRKSSDDARNASEEHDKLSHKMAAHVRNSNNRFESLEKRMDPVEAKLESLTTYRL
ncbi:hypothetical protein HPB51_025922 [Rhipicephalus microplus]|uniref:Uncharacterized protein n=1 Tax=Rhipicephalus microplus TaxID=6941 RepID=A0A9J6EEE4_RHIMP|nr:hypothetical protein HPB51_025922 [Rhipicephalus microplus]